MSDVKQFNLNVATRLTLLMHLPEQGSVTDMIAKRNVRKKIDLSSQEVEDYKVINKDGRVQWSSSAPSIEVEFTKSEIEFLKGIIKKLDESGSVTDNILEFAEAVLKENDTE